MSPESGKCLCPGDVALTTYECTVPGRGNTVWKGSALDDRCDEIVLDHNRYASPGAYRSCSNETIVARGLPVEVNEIYTSQESQLKATLTIDQAGKTLECSHDNGTSETTVASTELEISPGIARSCALKV